MAYNSESHGFSLQSLYRHVSLSTAGKSNEPCLLVIRDTRGHRFGAVVPDTFRIQDREKFYGSGETFVFTLEEEEEKSKVWRFAHSNFYVIFCSHDNLSVGSGDGHPAIWLDSDLDKGRSDVCPTYQSEPLVPGGDFQVSSVEVWIFDE